MSFCAAKKKSGSPCGGKRVPGSKFCTFHDPKRAKKVAGGRQAGGREATRSKEKPAPPMPCRSPEDIEALAEDTINRVRAGTLGPKVGAAISSLIGAALANRKAKGSDGEKEGERPLRELTAEQLMELARGLSSAQQQ